MPSESLKTPVPDAELLYWPQFVPAHQADEWLEGLISGIEWEQHLVKLFGKSIAAPRLSAWYGDPDATYGYSGVRYAPKAWTPLLSCIRSQVEAAAEAPFNSVLCNRYRNGSDSMGWHSDDEPELGDDPVIASLTLGSERRFVLRHKSRKDVPDVEYTLAHGSLLVMAGKCQKAWRHQLPKSRRVSAERVNLTFRLIREVRKEA